MNDGMRVSIILALRQMHRTLHEHALIFCGFSLLWVWIWAVFQSSILKTGSSATFENQYLENINGTFGWTAPVLFYAMGFLVLALLYYFKRRVPCSRIYRSITMVCVVIGLWGVGSPFIEMPLPDVIRYAFDLVFSLFLGLGTAFIHVEYGRISGSIGLRKTLIVVSLGTIPASLILVTMTALPPIANGVLLTISIVLCALIAYRAFPSKSFGGVVAKRTPVRISRKLMATAFMQGCSLGAIEILLEGSSKEVSLALTVSGFSLGALLVLAVSLLLKQDYNRLLYSLGFPLMAAGCILIALLAPHVSLGGVTHAIGYRLVDVLIWSVMAYVMSKDGQSANWITPVATLCLVAGQFSGIFACFYFTNAFGDLRGAEIGGTIIAFALMLCAVLATNSQNMRIGWGMVKPVEETEPIDSFSASCIDLAVEYGLTARESEVFAYLAKGYPRQYICDKLVLADGTVKSHIRRIYVKMDIHSRNDAIMLVEEHMKKVGDNS